VGRERGREREGEGRGRGREELLQKKFIVTKTP